VVLLTDSKNANFNRDKYELIMVQSTNIRLLMRNEMNNTERQIQVVHAENAEPLKNPILKTYNNPRPAFSNLTLNKEVEGDKSGIFNADEFGNGAFFRVSQGNDEYWQHNWYYNHPGNNYYNANREVKFFLDRRIYRPGQVVHFKAIAFRQERGAEAVILKNQDLNVELLDANNQLIANKELTTNDFGSVAGSFVLPSSTLSGNFIIRSFGYSYSFKVENYKRPSFKVDVIPSEEKYSLGDSVELNGKVKTYSGASVSDATVTFTVHRRVVYPRFYCYFYGMPSRGQDVLLSSGEVKSNSKGEFTIPYHLSPDPAADTSMNPYFTYSISTEVMDETGETIVSNFNRSAGFNDYQLNVSVSEISRLDELPSINIDAHNYENQAIDAEVRVIIEELKQPDQLYKTSYPEISVIPGNEQEFREKLPHLGLKNEKNPSYWEVNAQIYSGKLKANKNYSLEELNLEDIKPGSYRVRVKNQQEEVFKIFHLYDEGRSKRILKRPLFLKVNPQSARAGDLVDITLSSAMEEANIHLQVLFLSI